jgi:hypothetical protein
MLMGHCSMVNGLTSSMKNVRTCQKMTEVTRSSTHLKIKFPIILGTVAIACHMTPSLPLLPDILPTPPFNQKLHMYHQQNDVFFVLYFSLLMQPLFLKILS